MRNLREISEDLARGRSSSRALTEAALALIADPDGEGARTFLHVYGDAALAAAEASDRLRHHGIVASPLAGIPVSIKDLFDVAGEVTRAGSRVLQDARPAAADAPVVARLRAAGAVVVGRTNMTEFAYSGLGINPHYGTPSNPWDRGAARLPGGSSSGAAVSVTDGMAAAAIGSDTGGSVRIPAALCGLVGFKPTAARVPLAGVLPLSTSLDSVGPLAPSVACCAILDAVLAGDPPLPPAPLDLAGQRLAVPQSYVLEDLDAAVAAGFARSLARLSAAGARVTEIPMRELLELPELFRDGGLVAAEAFAWHRALLEEKGEGYDPRVRSRIERGRPISAADYIIARERRAGLIRRAAAATSACDALVTPTVPMIAPPIADLADERHYFRINALMLRNPTVANVLDRCAVSLPCQTPGEAPVGLMLIGEHGADRRLLALAAAVEAALA